MLSPISLLCIPVISLFRLYIESVGISDVPLRWLRDNLQLAQRNFWEDWAHSVGRSYAKLNQRKSLPVIRI